MNALRSILLPMTLATLLAGCASAPPQTAPPVAAIKGRQAEIRRQIAPVCPAPLSPADLDRAATVVERHAADRDVTRVVGRLDRMDRETRVCRGVK